ncbi:PLDc N-terminal domain-containing protein [Actinomadura welshii]
MAILLVALFLFGVGFWVYCLLDVLRTDASEVRHLPKGGWFAVVLVGFLAGSVVWLVVGRDRRPAPAVGSRTAAPRGPDDDPAFLSDLERRLRDEDG